MVIFTSTLATALGMLSLLGGLSSASGLLHKPKIVYRADADKTPSARYGAMAPAACLAELKRRGVAVTPVARAPGVLAPVRLAKDLGGVVYRTAEKAHARGQSPHGVFDCRLVLALHDFSAVLRAHDVDEVLMFSAWRPPPKGWPEEKPGKRHPGALAVDLYRFGKKATAEGAERVWLDVEKDFHGKRGAPPCGPDAVPPAPPTPAARELRNIFCEAVDQHFFAVNLTPNYDKAHENHFHLEVTAGVKWQLVR